MTEPKDNIKKMEHKNRKLAKKKKKIHLKTLSSFSYSEDEKPAILIHVQLEKRNEYDLSEIKGLAEAAGYSIFHSFSQSRKNPHAKYFIGAGKVEKIKVFIESYYEENEIAEDNMQDPFDQYFEQFGEIYEEIDKNQDEKEIFVKNKNDKDVIDKKNPKQPQTFLENNEIEKEILDKNNNNPIQLNNTLDFNPYLPHEITIIFNNRLGYTQMLALQKRWGVNKVLDRDLLVLEIFEKRARTREAMLQIELARMTLQTNLIKKEFGAALTEKQGRGHMGKGMPGWAPMSRALTMRRKKIMQELRIIAKYRAQRRFKRNKFFNIGLIGYTNAGKTSLLNSLAKTVLETANHEFTTLNPVSRKIWIPSVDNMKINDKKYLNFSKFDKNTYKPGYELIVTDSVGFIEDLSPLLVNAFLSTLEELTAVNLLLLVFDISEENEKRIYRKIAASFSILHQISADEIPILLIPNKIDLLKKEELEKRLTKLNKKYSKYKIIPIAAKNKSGFPNLFNEIRVHLQNFKIYKKK